jgi:hypothetical protein
MNELLIQAANVCWLISMRMVRHEDIGMNEEAMVVDIIGMANSHN